MSIRIIAIGASAGGVQALGRLLMGLPGVLGATIIIALHRSGRHESHLASVLRRLSIMPVSVTTDGEPIRRDRICLAPLEQT